MIHTGIVLTASPFRDLGEGFSKEMPPVIPEMSFLGNLGHWPFFSYHRTKDEDLRRRKPILSFPG